LPGETVLPFLPTLLRRRSLVWRNRATCVVVLSGLRFRSCPLTEVFTVPVLFFSLSSLPPPILKAGVWAPPSKKRVHPLSSLVRLDAMRILTFSFPDDCAVITSPSAVSPPLLGEQIRQVPFSWSDVPFIFRRADWVPPPPSLAAVVSSPFLSNHPAQLPPQVPFNLFLTFLR